ncbi:Glucan endo-1,3-beta-glucosidase 13 [Heracleum sosnowskyi]|uniref:Glucan endo-1,3-beta-glucosidase 13 n=1 Tax=Heracleum sosnowskyi TaxID=360622 RepID=A0AAD8IBG5_9APIA|nr:Glucan endo-1,3-beta-glucosidase 13 [Heracleum sosnowskyi]
MKCCSVNAVEMVSVEEKTDITNYQPVLTPPEGNTTFLDGTSWCVARPGVSQGDLQDALDWACGMGKTDCGPIKSGGPCFQPNTLLSHASFAFNSYYQQNGNSDIACNFGGTAALTKRNPSYGKCAYSTSESLRASTSALSRYKQRFMQWKLSGILLLLYMGG